MASSSPWKSLGVTSDELRLEYTLPTGQTFRWRQTSTTPDSFIGVLGQRIVHLKQLDDDVHYRILGRSSTASPDEDQAALSDYFNLGHIHLSTLTPTWCQKDPHFAKVNTYIRGARMLRQDPVECLFQFICSSNNHISRIHGMVERLCSTYGQPIPLLSSVDVGDGEDDGDVSINLEDLSFYAFPTLQQLSKATETDLRSNGFGYRAKFIVNSTSELLTKPVGGHQWLTDLRSQPFDQAVDALCTLCGVGPKVAACVALFSLDKHEAVPVDVHVWRLATKHYVTHLRGKTNTPNLHPEVQAAFTDMFGPYAGWAHNTLFISELASVKKKIADEMEMKGGVKKEEESEEEEGSGDDGDGEREELVVMKLKHGVGQIEVKAPLTPNDVGTVGKGVVGGRRKKQRRTTE